MSKKRKRRERENYIYIYEFSFKCYHLSSLTGKLTHTPPPCYVQINSPNSIFAFNNKKKKDRLPVDSDVHCFWRLDSVEKERERKRERDGVVLTQLQEEDNH